MLYSYVNMHVTTQLQARSAAVVAADTITAVVTATTVSTEPGENSYILNSYIVGCSVNLLQK